MNVQGFAPALQAAAASVTARVISSVVICENVPGETAIGSGRHAGIQAKPAPVAALIPHVCVRFARAGEEDHGHAQDRTAHPAPCRHAPSVPLTRDVSRRLRGRVVRT